MYMKITLRLIFWVFSILLLLAIPIMMVRQGLAMSDEGSILISAQQIFKEPSSVAYYFLYYGGIFWGGVWNSLFSDFGIYGFRVFEVIVKFVCFLLVLLILRGKISKWNILLAFVMLYLENDTQYYHHNTLSSMFLLISTLLLVKGLYEDKKTWLFFAGIVLGINFFTRLTNVATSLLVLSLIPYYIYNKELKKILLMFCYGVSGTFIGVGIVLLTMVVIGHFPVFLDTINTAFGLASGDSGSSHSLPHLLHLTLYNYKVLLIRVIVFSLFPLILFASYKYVSNKFIRYTVLLILLLASLFVVSKCLQTNIWIEYALCTIGVLWAFYRYYKKDQYLFYTSCCALLFMFSLPLGGDQYMTTMGVNALWLSAPFFIECLYRTLKNGEVTSRVFFGGYVIGVCFLVSNLIIKKINYCYDDPGSRRGKIYTPSLPHINVCTTIEEGKELESLYAELRKYVKPGDYLLAAQCLTTLHYITETKPYMYSPGPLVYSTEQYAYSIEKARKEHGLPVVVRAKSSVDHWMTYIEDWEKESKTNAYFFVNEKNAILDSFLEHNKYQVAWEDKYFIIYKV